MNNTIKGNSEEFYWIFDQKTFDLVVNGCSFRIDEFSVWKWWYARVFIISVCVCVFDTNTIYLIRTSSSWSFWGHLLNCLNLSLFNRVKETVCSRCRTSTFIYFLLCAPNTNCSWQNCLLPDRTHSIRLCSNGTIHIDYSQCRTISIDNFSCFSIYKTFRWPFEDGKKQQQSRNLA